MHFVYILHSQSIQKFYIGSTSYLVKTRLQQHNNSFYPNSFTAKGIPWTIYLVIECLSITQARKIEAHIKKMKSKAYIENLKKYPELKSKLLHMFPEAGSR